MVVVIRIQNRQALDNIRRITQRFPLAVEEGAEDIAKSAVRRLKRAVRAKDLIWTKRLINGIYYKKVGKSYEVRMPLHGVYIDSMRPHFVRLKKTRLIHRWATEKGNLGVKMAAAEERGIFVRPHPFIRGPMRRTIKDVPKIIKRRTNRTVHSRGRK